MKILATLAAAAVLALSCTPQEETPIVWKTIQRSLQEQLTAAADGDTIVIPAGRYMFTRGLQMDGKKDIVIRGAGKDSTVLSFRDQAEGAQGILITNGVNITVEDMTLEDAKGDNIKISDTDGITLRRIRSQWTGEPKSTNGAYALYPVLSKHVLIEECEAIGSSDAGIYVGQSDSVIIRNNKAWHNVAGIESENSRWVEIYDNEAWDNAGGLLVFDLPGLTQYGHSTRMYRNSIHDNNHENFATPGNIVAGIPSGCGIMILATHDLEMFDNTISNNKTVGTGIISYDLVAALSAEDEVQNESPGGTQTVNDNYKLDTLYNPYPYNIRIRGNLYENSHWLPTLSHDIGLLFLMKSFASPPDIAFDGIRPDASDPQICTTGNNGANTILYLDAAHDFEGFEKNPARLRCSDQ
ncbi:MAG: parallel beta-helix domain-containing protein [Bacteroidota bacterium]